ncbi:MAG: hypothetical protein ACYDDQ_12300 [Vulcanimicrobiaceae bacterium]
MDGYGSIIATLQRNQACGGALPPNTPITSNNGLSEHDNSIWNVFIIQVSVNGFMNDVGWMYQTYGGQEYFQFNGSFSGSVSGGISFVQIGVSYGTGSGPFTPWSGSLYNVISSFANSQNWPIQDLPFPFNEVTPKSSVNEISCY